MILVVLATLAVWRASLMITDEEGPFGVFLWLREHIDPHQKTWVGRGINCVWCVSWWAGLVTAVWVWVFGAIALWELPIWWFGLSGGAIVFQSWMSNLGRRQR